jgi:hypothetical protein
LNPKVALLKGIKMRNETGDFLKATILLKIPDGRNRNHGPGICIADARQALVWKATYGAVSVAAALRQKRNALRG